MKRVVQKLLGEILIEQGRISKQDLEKALKVQKNEGGLLGQILVKMKMVTEQEIVTTLATQFGYPYLPVTNCQVESSILKLIPDNVARQYHVIPIDRIGNILTVVMADPTNVLALKDIEYTTGCKVQTFVASATEIQESLNRLYKSSRSTGLEKLSSDEKVSRINFATVAREQESNDQKPPEEDPDKEQDKDKKPKKKDKE